MKIIVWMLSRMIFVRFIGVLLGITLSVLTLELVSYTKEILALDTNTFLAVGRYMFVRSASLLTVFLPMSLLLAMLITISELSYRNELTAIWATGVSPLRLISLLLPIAIVTSGLYFTLSDQAVPAAATVLKQWGIGDYKAKKRELNAADPIWMRAGNDILRAANISENGNQLNEVTIFQRDDRGNLVNQIIAKSAMLENGKWKLADATTYDRSQSIPRKTPFLIYEGKLQPAAFGARSGDPEEMTMSALSYYIANAGFGIKPVWVYETWWHKRMTLLLTPLVMIALCVPLAATFRRGGGMGILFALGVTIGFLFFIIDGIAISMGELGFVAPWLAAWTPALSFAALASYLGLRTEKV